nr:hypothetical protein [Chlorosarcina stigmatica]
MQQPILQNNSLNIVLTSNRGKVNVRNSVCALSNKLALKLNTNINHSISNPFLPFSEAKEIYAALSLGSCIATFTDQDHQKSYADYFSNMEETHGIHHKSRLIVRNSRKTQKNSTIALNIKKLTNCVKQDYFLYFRGSYRLPKKANIFMSKLSSVNKNPLAKHSLDVPNYLSSNQTYLLFLQFPKVIRKSQVAIAKKSFASLSFLLSKRHGSQYIVKKKLTYPNLYFSQNNFDLNATGVPMRSIWKHLHYRGVELFPNKIVKKHKLWIKNLIKNSGNLPLPILITKLNREIRNWLTFFYSLNTTGVPMRSIWKHLHYRGNIELKQLIKPYRINSIQFPKVKVNHGSANASKCFALALPWHLEFYASRNTTKYFKKFDFNMNVWSEIDLSYPECDYSKNFYNSVLGESLQYLQRSCTKFFSVAKTNYPIIESAMIMKSINVVKISNTSNISIGKKIYKINHFSYVNHAIQNLLTLAPQNQLTNNYPQQYFLMSKANNYLPASLAFLKSDSRRRSNALHLEKMNVYLSKLLWHWAKRRHNNRSNRWIFQKYWTFINNKPVFYVKDQKRTYYLILYV